MLATLTGALGLSAGLCVGGLQSAAPIALRCHTRLCAQEDPLRTSPAATLVSSVFKAGEGKEIYLGLLTRDVDSTTVMVEVASNERFSPSHPTPNRRAHQPLFHSCRRTASTEQNTEKNQSRHRPSFCVFTTGAHAG